MLRSYSSLLRMHWVKGCRRYPLRVFLFRPIGLLPSVETSHLSMLLLGSLIIHTRMAALAIVLESKRDNKEPANPNNDE